MTEQSFRTLGVRREIVRTLEARDIHAPFQIQTLVIPDALAGADVLAKSPTGSGKTLAFGIPILERTPPGEGGPFALVLVPTRELAAQVAAELDDLARAVGLNVAAAYGGVSIGTQAKAVRRADVLIATPGRLRDLVERRLVSLDKVGILVLDEADRMLDMGFKPQVDVIVRRLPRERQTMFFSATLDGEVGELARLYTRDPARFESSSAPKADVPSFWAGPGEIEHTFVPVTEHGKVDRLVEELDADRDLALVFVRTKRGAERLVRKLRERDVKAVAMHGDMTQSGRERALAQFRSGRVKTLVATDVAARGLDMVDITHVINFDPPEDEKGYLHRVGRTGRAGRGGTGITLVLPEQQTDVSRVAAKLGRKQEFEREGMRSARPRKVYTSRRGARSRW